MTNPGVIGGSAGFISDGLFEGLALPELPIDIAPVLLGANDSVGVSEPNNELVLAEFYDAAIGELVDALLGEGMGRVILMTPPQNLSTTASLLLGQYAEKEFGPTVQEQRMSSVVPISTNCSTPRPISRPAPCIQTPRGMIRPKPLFYPSLSNSRKSRLVSSSGCQFYVLT